MIRTGVAVLSIALFFLTSAFAQGSRQIIVGFPPGGTFDVLARTIASGWPDPGGMVVVNRPGGYGVPAAIWFREQASPNGQVLLLAAQIAGKEAPPTEGLVIVSELGASVSHAQPIRLFAPPGTPKATLDELRSMLVPILQSEKFKAAAERFGVVTSAPPKPVSTAPSSVPHAKGTDSSAPDVNQNAALKPYSHRAARFRQAWTAAYMQCVDEGQCRRLVVSDVELSSASFDAVVYVRPGQPVKVLRCFYSSSQAREYIFWNEPPPALSDDEIRDLPKRHYIGRALSGTLDSLVDRQVAQCPARHSDADAIRREAEQYVPRNEREMAQRTRPLRDPEDEHDRRRDLRACLDSRKPSLTSNPYTFEYQEAVRRAEEYCNQRYGPR